MPSPRIKVIQNYNQKDIRVMAEIFQERGFTWGYGKHVPTYTQLKLTISELYNMFKKTLRNGMEEKKISTIEYGRILLVATFYKPTVRIQDEFIAIDLYLDARD